MKAGPGSGSDDDYLKTFNVYGYLVLGRTYEKALESFLKSNPYYANNSKKVAEIKEIKTEQFSYDDKLFQKKYEDNKDTYNKIALATGLSAELIAAMHYRESRCDFTKTIRNGTEKLPSGKTFVENAIDVINGFIKEKNKEQTSFGAILPEANKGDITSMLTIAEFWNGTGYADARRINSYLYSGTNVYVSGKYVIDGSYSSTAIDGQPGVYILLKFLGL